MECIAQTSSVGSYLVQPVFFPNHFNPFHPNQTVKPITPNPVKMSDVLVEDIESDGVFVFTTFTSGVAVGPRLGVDVGDGSTVDFNTDAFGIYVGAGAT